MDAGATGESETLITSRTPWYLALEMYEHPHMVLVGPRRANLEESLLLETAAQPILCRQVRTSRMKHHVARKALTSLGGEYIIRVVLRTRMVSCSIHQQDLNVVVR